jgi:hypothetical protein
MLASKSLPSLLSIDKLIENERFSKDSLFKKTETTLCDMGTQTTTMSSCSSIGQDSEEFEDNSPTRNQVSSESLDANACELKLVKKKIPILKHQLTRDSGIDSDNAQQKLIRPKKQIVLSNREDNSAEKEDLNERRGSAGLSTVSSTKRPSSGIKSLTIKTSNNNSEQANSSPSKLYILSSSTRDSSMDFGEPNSSSLEDLGIDNSNSNSNSHSNDLVDEDDEIMLNLFKRNVRDEDDESESKTKENNASSNNNVSDDQFDEAYDYNKQQRRSFDAASNKRRIFKSN